MTTQTTKAVNDEQIQRLVQTPSEVERNRLEMDEDCPTTETGFVRQPTASEVWSLIGLSASQTRAQDLSNRFSRLLNRGSSLE